MSPAVSTSSLPVPALTELPVYAGEREQTRHALNGHSGKAMGLGQGPGRRTDQEGLSEGTLESGRRKRKRRSFPSTGQTLCAQAREEAGAAGGADGAQCVRRLSFLAKSKGISCAL